MTTKLSSETIAILRKTIAQPCLANSRELEGHLIAKGFQRKTNRRSRVCHHRRRLDQGNAP